LLTGSRDISVMLIGAGLVGLSTAFLIDWLHKKGRLQEDASIGIIFTGMFALAVILISAYSGQVDLDQECVLYGEIAFAPFDTIAIGGHDFGPRAFWALVLVTLLNGLFLWIGYYRLKLMSFNASFAATLGIQVGLWHYGLMALVSTTTVASFDAVGAILVVALIVIPANTAYLIARSFGGMLVWAAVFGALSSVLGYFVAKGFDASISAAIACVAALIFAGVFAFIKIPFFKRFAA
jgi:manganese/zinc/iron transport system permease protein